MISLMNIHLPLSVPVAETPSPGYMSEDSENQDNKMDTSQPADAGSM